MLSSCAPEPKQIVIWHWMADRQGAFNNLSKMYFNEAGIKAKFVLCVPSDRYAKKIRFAAVMRRLPDVYGVALGHRL